MSNVQDIQFRVFPSSETNDCEVRIFVDGEALIEKNWPDMMGMDPDDVLSFDHLAPRELPHRAMIVRCGCGIAGCGNVTVRISGEGNRVIWDSWDGGRDAGTLIFERGQYLEGLAQAVNDKDWETPDRTASRLLFPLIDHEVLAARKLSFQWASGRIRDNALTISLAGPPSHHQILLHVSWKGDPPPEIARKAAELLSRDPGEWLDVNWNGEAAPPFDGPGWRR